MEILVLILEFAVLLIIIAMGFGVALTDTLKFYNKEFFENKNQILGKRKYKKTINSLKISDEFETLYELLYDKNNAELEKRRKKYRISYTIECISAVGLIISMVGTILVLCFINTMLFPKIVKWGIMSFVVFCAFVFLCVKNKNFSKYKQDYIYYFKNNIIGTLVKNIFGEFYYNYGQNKENYIGDAAVAYKLYAEASFNNEKPVGVQCTDYILTDLNSTSQIIIADIKDNTKAFTGMFTFIKTTKILPDKICIVKNNAAYYYNEHKVNLDSYEFEKYFDVYSSNKILAMQILTSDVVNVIEDFYNKLKLQFEIIIKENAIYIRFITGNILEAKIFKSAIDKKSLFVYYSVLKFINELSTSINKVIAEVNI